jgi:hypothetical protein
MFNTLKFFSRIKRINTVCEGSKTQMSADLHERAVMEIFTDCGVNPFNPSAGNSKENSHVFREWFKTATGEASGFKSEYKDKYPIINSTHIRASYITPNTPWIIHQPNGSQNFPDFVVFKIVDNTVNMLYVECKSKKPSFNNNPPKKNPNCIYICENILFNGYFLRSHDNVAIYDRFLTEYRALIERYKAIEGYDMIPVCYKKNEFKKFPPPFFAGKEKINRQLNWCLIKNILE